MTSGSTERPLPELMTAAVLREGSAPRFTLERIPLPVPSAGEVLLRVEACGVCHSDLHVAKGDIPFPKPAVLGHEVSGTVVDVGADVHGYGVGDRVVAGFIIPCGKCENCKEGRDDICSVFYVNNRINGTMNDGHSRLVDGDGERLNMYSASAFAEYCVVPTTGLSHVSPDLELATAAVLGCAGMTAYGAVTRAAGDVAGKATSVFAVGGVGLSIVQVLAAVGAEPIVAVDLDDDKLELARSLGATHTINAANEDPVERIRDITGAGVSIAFEALGNPVTVNQAIRSLAQGGRAVAVGLAASGAVAEVPITSFVRQGQELVGSYGARTRQDLPAVEALAAAGDMSLGSLVTKEYSLSQINEAYQDLEAGRILGRGLIRMEGTS